MTPCDRRHIHLISDSTGETLHVIARAALARFSGAEVAVHVSVFVRSAEELEAAIARIRRNPGLVLHTVVDHGHRARLMEAAREAGAEAFGVLDPHLELLTRFLGRAADEEPGMQHRIDDEYFRRIAALDFAIAFDDGAPVDRLKRADVILTGVSRTSKTPTCIYLAYRGVKAANMPLVPGRQPDPSFFEAMAAGVPVVGLIASPGRLEQVRRQRMESLGDRTPDYVDPDRIRGEVSDSRLFFERHGIPVIDVTRRSIEETAAAILALLRSREQAGAA